MGKYLSDHKIGLVDQLLRLGFYLLGIGVEGLELLEGKWVDWNFH